MDLKTTYYAGAARENISIDPSWLPMEHFYSVHDTPYIRAMLLKTKSGDGSFLLLSMELTSLLGGTLEIFREKAALAAGLDRSRVWISVTHTFSIPHIPDGEGAWRSAWLDALERAVHKCKQTMEPARLFLGSGASAVNANRDIQTPQGWWVGINSNGVSDRSVNVLRIDALSGSLIAAVFNYGMQSSVLDQVCIKSSERIISTDLIGKTCRVIEESCGGVAMFLPGASGDQCPRLRAVYDSVDSDGVIKTTNWGAERGFEMVSQLGQELASDTMKALQCAEQELSDAPIKMDRLVFLCPKQVKQFEGFPVPTLNYCSIPDGVIETSAEILQFGDSFAIVGVLPELGCLTGLQIRHDSPISVTWVAQMINGGQKYMADERSFERGTYEAMNGFAGKGSAEELVRQIHDFWGR